MAQHNIDSSMLLSSLHHILSKEETYKSLNQGGNKINHVINQGIKNTIITSNLSKIISQMHVHYKCMTYLTYLPETQHLWQNFHFFSLNPLDIAYYNGQMNQAIHISMFDYHSQSHVEMQCLIPQHPFFPKTTLITYQIYTNFKLNKTLLKKINNIHIIHFLFLLAKATPSFMHQPKTFD